MSLRWSSYVAPKSPKGGAETQNGRFGVKLHFAWRVCYKVFVSENCQRQSCKAFVGLTVRAKMIGGEQPLLRQFWVKLTALERSLFARSASTVTPSEKSLIITFTNRKFTTPFPSPRWALYAVPKPQREAKNAVSKIWTISCNNSETVRDSMSVTINH